MAVEKVYQPYDNATQTSVPKDNRKPLTKANR